MKTCFKTKLVIIVVLFSLTLIAQAQDPQVNLLPTNVSNFNIGPVGNGHSGNNLSNVNVTTNYTYKKDENSLQSNTQGPQCYAVGDNARFYNHQTNWSGIEQGFFEMGDHTSGTGNYMIVNGATSSNKKVWEYTVPVSPGVIYDFKAWTTCLFMKVLGLPSDGRPRLRLKINDEPIPNDNPFTVPWVDGGQWTLWSKTWTAGNNTTSAKITIIDECTDADGNDFGLDDIVFKMKDGYSLTANNITVSYCDDIPPIDLTNYYWMTYPDGGNSAPPIQVKIRKNSSQPWETSITTNHGSAYVGSDNKIYYTPNAGYYGQDDFRYQISRFGLEVHKTITINVGDVPSNCIPQGLPSDGHICLSNISSFNPSANWTSNGSNITNPQWQWKKDGVTGWQNSNAFLSYVQGQGGVGEYSIKFLATNDCGSVESDPYSITVCDVPQWITQPSVTSVCTGSAEPTVSVDMKFNSGVQTWQYKRGSGNWTDFVWGEFALQPGDQIRYRVTWDYCGGGPLTSSVINVVSGPEFINSIPVTFAEGYCPGSQVTLPQIQSSWYNAFGMSVTAHWYYVINNPSGSPDYQQINGNTITLNNGSVSVTPCLQNTECGFTPYYPAFDLVVWEAPSIQGMENLPDTLGPYCDGQTTLSSVLPTLTPGGHYLGYGWEISSGQNQSGFSSNLPTVLSLADNGRWLRYHVTKDCSAHADAYSTPIRLWVVDEPTVGSISNIVPAAVCEPYTPAFSTPNIQTHGSDLIYPETGWQMQINGQWVPLPNPIEYQHNGKSIRYHALNDCGEANSNVVQLAVNAIPIVNNIQAPDGICEGTALNLPNTNSIVTWRHNDSNTCIGGWEIQINGEWVSLTNSNIPFDYNGCLIRYKARNGCCDEGEYVYSNEVVITVYSTEPVVLPDVTFCQPGYYHGVWCEQNEHVYGYDSLTPNNCTIHVSWLFHLIDDFNVVPQTEVGCDEFHWSQNGMTYYESGVYYDTVVHPNPEDCDDLYVLTLTINHAPEFTTQLEAPNPTEVCASSGFLNVSAPSFVNGGTPHWECKALPNGTWTEFNPAAFNLGYGSYSLRYVVDNDCVDVPVSSNVVPFYVSEAPAVSIAGGQQLQDMQICDGEVPDWPQVLVAWNDQPGPQRVRRWEKSLSQEGPFVGFDTTAAMHSDCWIRYYVQNTCEHQELGPVHVSVITMQDITEDHEDCDMVEYGGVQYTMDTVIDVLMEDPCPYTVHHNIIVHPSEYTMEPIAQTTCYDDFLWHGHIYYRSDGLQQLMHWDTVTEYGCTKVVEQQLIFDDYSSKTETRIGCGEYYWSRNDSTYVYDENQPHIVDSWFIPGNDVVCDSIIYLVLDLGIDYEMEGEPIAPICYGEEWHGVTYYQDAIVYDSLQTAITQCDSIVRYHLTVVQPFDTAVEMASCKPMWWYCQDQEHLFDEDDEEFTATLVSQVTGCDSTVRIHFSLLPEIVMPIEDVMICEPLVLPDGQVANYSDLWTYRINSLDGCDTIVSLQVTFTQIDTVSDFVSACNEFTFQNQVYYAGFHQIYYDTLFYANGCDSIVHCMNLTVTEAEQMGAISGSHEVYVSSSLISGVYRYDFDTEGIVGSVEWTLSNPDWAVLEATTSYCRILVATPGSATLTARFETATCGMMERHFDIHGGFFGLDESGVEVSIYPNPTKGSLTIETEGIRSVRLINMMGQTLDWVETDRADHLTMNLNGFPPSVYLLEIDTVNGMVKRRVVVCR